MRLTQTLALCLLLVAPAARAADTAGLAAARRGLYAATSSGSATDLRRARDAFALLQANDAASPEIAYWLALADWRLVPMLLDSDKPAAKQLCKEGIAACDRAVAVRPKFAEAVALKAGLQGMAFMFLSSQAAMSIGAEMEESYGRASGLEPGNPRVMLLRGINVLHKPKEVGGGPDKARPLLERAVAAFAVLPPADSTAIDWGRDDAIVWSGICASRMGDWVSARERFRQVLALNPGHAWTRYVLLPEAEKQLAAKPDSAAVAK
jgi:hypothetical protein